RGKADAVVLEIFRLFISCNSVSVPCYIIETLFTDGYQRLIAGLLMDSRTNFPNKSHKAGTFFQSWKTVTHFDIAVQNQFVSFGIFTGGVIQNANGNFEIIE